MNSSLTNLSAQQLRRAAGIKVKIDVLQKKLGRIFGATGKNENPKSEYASKQSIREGVNETVNKMW
jgi:hypothetical protein